MSGSLNRRATRNEAASHSIPVEQGSRAFDEAFNHHFASGLVEIDGQFIAIDGRDRAITKFDMKNAIAQLKA